MIYSLKGTLVHTEQNLAVVECGGVGYGCRTTLNTLKDLKLNTEVKLYTYMSVREDAVELFGFSTVSELNTYKLLINVNGVGPKAGISILSILSPNKLQLQFLPATLRLLPKLMVLDLRWHRELSLN